MKSFINDKVKQAYLENFGYWNGCMKHRHNKAFMALLCVLFFLIFFALIAVFLFYCVDDVYASSTRDIFFGSPSFVNVGAILTEEVRQLELQAFECCTQDYQRDYLLQMKHEFFFKYSFMHKEYLNHLLTFYHSNSNIPHDERIAIMTSKMDQFYNECRDKYIINLNSFIKRVNTLNNN